MYLEQPQGNVAVPKLKTVEPTAAGSMVKAGTDYAGPLKEMIGSYENEESKRVLEIGVRDGKVALVVPGQPPYQLAEKAKDKLASPTLGEAYWVDINRDAAGKVSGIVINQPEGHFAFRRLADVSAGISVDDLLTKIIAASGGELNLRKHKSSQTTIEVDFENQGVVADGVITARAPDSSATSITLKALGKNIGSIVEYFDGTRGGQHTTFTPDEVFTGKRLADVKRESDFYGVLNWKQNYKTISIKRMSKVGDEDAYVLELIPETGNTTTAFISTRSFLPLRVESVISSETSGVDLPRTTTLSDYRSVDGVMVSFKSVSNDVANGDVVVRIKDVKWDVEIPDAAFRKPQ